MNSGQKDSVAILLTSLGLFGLIGGCSVGNNQTEESGSSLENYWKSIVGRPLADFPSNMDPLAPQTKVELEIIHDASSLVGLETADRFNRQSPDWTIVAVCADGPDPENATTVELAVVPTVAINDGMRKDFDQVFADSVTCEGRPYRP